MKEENYTGSKERFVKQIFADIASGYETANNVISLGMIHHWRRKMVQLASPAPESRILDLCTGTGMVMGLLAEELNSGQVVGVDFSPEMIEIARNRLQDKYGELVEFRTGNVKDLSFAANSFDYVFIAFGLRNVDEIERVLAEMRRVVKKGGEVFILDLARPRSRIFSGLYYLYFNHLLPLLGGIIQGQKKAYSYLAKSLQSYPDQERMKELLVMTGFQDVKFRELTGGIVAIHRGKK